jgi:hypothetical protein
MGYEQDKNDPCAFIKYGEKAEARGNKKEVPHGLMVHVDDILSRGSPKQSEVFYKALAERFQCKDPEYLTEDNSIVYTGVEIAQTTIDG